MVILCSGLFVHAACSLLLSSLLLLPLLLVTTTTTTTLMIMDGDVGGYDLDCFSRCQVSIVMLVSSSTASVAHFMLKLNDCCMNHAASTFIQITAHTVE